MANIILTADVINGLVNSSELFPIDLDDAWVWAGYTRKENARQKLKSSLIEGVDFFTKGCKSSTGGRSSEWIVLSLDGFQHFCLMANTAKGREVRQHFIECRNSLKKAVETIQRQQDDIWHWKARAMEAEERLVAKKEAITQLHPPHIAGLILGISVEVPEIEKPVIEVIDDRHNVRFKGQTLVQVVEFLKTKYDIRFKSGADLKRWLERNELSGLIAQTPRTITSDYVPDEHLEELYKAVIKSDQQKLIGE